MLRIATLLVGLLIASAFLSAADPAPAFHVEPYLQLPTTSSMTIMWETTAKLPGKVEYGETESLGQTVEQQEPVALHQVPLTGLKPGTPYHYRVRSGDLVSKMNVFKTAPPAGTKKWRMALYGDSRSNPTVHRKIADLIAKANVDLILHTGDIVLNGNNYDLWRKEFFEPVAPYRGKIPWVSTIGNHEADSKNYFSYMALPGNERHFSLDYANAHIVCLDSNGWIEKGRDSKQFKWMEEDLKRPKDTTWTFIAFHHPLFSAHATRSINSLRWDWAPLFLDPACHVDGVLAGHDHFYARNWCMAKIGEPKIGENSAHGTLFMTSAGGGASLYPVKERDYLAKIKAVHHFTLFDFNGDEVTLSAIDMNGQVFDTYKLSKKPTPPEELCAYEIEDLRNFIRLALGKFEPVPVSADKATTIDAILEVPTRFQIPLKGKFVWHAPTGWKMKAAEVSFEIQPNEPLKIPLQAEVDANAVAATPMLKIEFEPGKFRNRSIEVYPIKLAGPRQIVAKAVKGITTEGTPFKQVWEKAVPYYLSGVTGSRQATLAEEVRLATDGDNLLVVAKFDDHSGRITPAEPKEGKKGSRAVLSGEHVRVEINDGKETHIFALSPEQVRFHTVDAREDDRQWHGLAGKSDHFWTAEVGIPLSFFADKSNLKINVAHRSFEPRNTRDFELRPGYGRGDSPDLIPDWRTTSNPRSFAELVLEKK